MAEATPMRFRDDAPCMEPAVTLDAFAEQTNAVAVRIEPGEDSRELIPHLERLCRIDIAFPAFTDGRGYSAARILREAGFEGELRAVGDVLIDQLFSMQRCGFDSFNLRDDQDQEEALKAFSTFTSCYQTDAREPRPLFRRRA